MTPFCFVFRTINPTSVVDRERAPQMSYVSVLPTTQVVCSTVLV